jgi:hypothetical protein
LAAQDEYISVYFCPGATAASAVSSRKTIAHDITARRFVTAEL